MEKEKKKEQGKESQEGKVYVCVVCGNKKKANQKIQCCAQDMLLEEKGNFNT